MPSPSPLLPLFLVIDSLISAEIREESHTQFVTSTFKTPGPSNEDISACEGGLMTSGDCCPQAIEGVHTEMPTTNGMSGFLNSKGSMSLIIPSENSEEAEPERVAVTVENSWTHLFTSENASATGSTLPPILLEATPFEGTVSWKPQYDHMPTRIITQPPP